MADFSDIQRRRARRGLPSRPPPVIFPPPDQRLGQGLDAEPVELRDLQAQPARIAEAFVYGPMMIFNGLGRSPPPWARTGMIILGVGTIVYALYRYFDIERRKLRAGVEAPGLGRLDYRMDRQAVVTGALYRPPRAPTV